MKPMKKMRYAPDEILTALQSIKKLSVKDCELDVWCGIIKNLLVFELKPAQMKEDIMSKKKHDPKDDDLEDQLANERIDHATTRNDLSECRQMVLSRDQVIEQLEMKIKELTNLLILELKAKWRFGEQH
jgi:hypothetical protein